ncbi:hypothetical protein ACP4OV_025799 [Aristida adscensionis]
MAKSKNGCLKILACAGAGSDPSAGSDADADDHPDENKAISDKSRWSFRRRSTRHRVLKNSDISEPETLSSSKAKSEIAPSNNVYSSTYSYASEKPLHEDKSDEKPLNQDIPDEKPLHEDKPDEKILHQDMPDEKPLHQEKSDENLMERTIEKSVEEPIEKPADQIVEKSIDLPAEKIMEAPIDEPAETVIETPSEKTAEKITEEPVKETSEDVVEEPTEKPNESVSVSLTELKQEETTALNEENSVNPCEDDLEPAAIVIQSGIRTCIAMRELSNQKDLVKLQAVIRGHLVRRQAVESLQCLLAIVKMQGLVRAHQSQQSAGMSKDTSVHSSSEKLLRNGFAVKLMNSMSTSKAIHIKCDPSESDDTWKWMERWTALIPPITVEHLLEHRENSELVVEKVKEDAQHDEKIVALESDLSFPKLVPDDVNETLGASDSNALETPACMPDENSELETIDEPESVLIEKNNVDADHVTNQKTEYAVEESLESSDQQSAEADASKEPTLLPENPESSNEDTNEQTLEMEDKRFVGRKSCNPAFAAAQLKFEELSTNSAVSRSNSSSNLDVASKSKVHTPRSQEDALSKQNNGTRMPESSVGHDSKVVVAASECGTEISISSTLDSPDRSEADGGEIVMEIGALENRNCIPDKADKDTDTVHPEVNITPQVEAQLQKEVQQNGHVANPEVATGPELVQEPHLELEKTDLNDQLERSVESYAKSPEGTPMSRTTIAESHGTPSSEVSVNTKKSKIKKPKSHASKRSLNSPSSDSVGRSSTDNFSKDYRHAKRESSIKSARSEHGDQEPRISNSNPLPSYMQFTESARAKASANASPKMSPDVQDNNPRKRHSLPMTNGKHDSSPRMQRSSSQAQQNVKSNGNATHNSSGEQKMAHLICAGLHGGEVPSDM